MLTRLLASVGLQRISKAPAQATHNITVNGISDVDAVVRQLRHQQPK